MPAQLNLCGISAVTALKMLEDAAREFPHIDLKGLTDINKLQEYITAVNFWDAKFPEEVEQFSTLTWHRTISGGFALSMPQADKLEIQQNILGTFDVSGVLNGRAISAVVDSLEHAFSRCDATVAKEASTHLTVLTREAKWHSSPAASAQIQTLMKLLRGKNQQIPPNISKGEASKAIGKLIAQFKPRAEKPLWLVAKIARESAKKIA
jgi:hypothetical protein